LKWQLDGSSFTNFVITNFMRIPIKKYQRHAIGEALIASPVLQSQFGAQNQQAEAQKIAIIQECHQRHHNHRHAVVINIPATL